MSKSKFQFNQINFFNFQTIIFFDTQNQDQKFDFNFFEFNVRFQFVENRLFTCDINYLKR